MTGNLEIRVVPEGIAGLWSLLDEPNRVISQMENHLQGLSNLLDAFSKTAHWLLSAAI